MAKLILLLLIAVASWLVTHWLVLSRWFGCDICGLTYSALTVIVVIVVAKFLWKIYSTRKAKRKQAKERKEKKVRLWNKLDGLGSAINNAKVLCLLDYFQLRDQLRNAKVDAIDALEAFQVKSLQLDDKYAKIYEMVYDADVNAFMLAGRESDVMIPAATFYFNSELTPESNNANDNDNDGNDADDGDGQSSTSKSVMSLLIDEGALPIAIVQKGIELASSLLLQHGAHFYIGQYSINKLSDIITAIAKKPIFASILSNQVPDGQFIVILSCDAQLPSLVAACIMPEFKTHVEEPVKTKQRVGYIFIHQRKSESQGRKLDEDSVCKMLQLAGEELVKFDSQSLLSMAITGTAQQVKNEIQRILSANSLTGLAIVCGTNHNLIQHAANFMEISIFSLTDHLTEVYLCHQYEHTANALAIAQSFGRAIQL